MRVYWTFFITANLAGIAVGFATLSPQWAFATMLCFLALHAAIRSAINPD